jgi:phospholipid/cholesterol/gamma-HCH transport system substrate-binding protein
MRRIATVAIMLAAIGFAVLLTGARSQREASGVTFKIAFDNAFGITEGGDLRVGGVKAGKMVRFDVSSGKECQGATPTDGPPRTCAIVESIITQDGFKDFRTDAHCDIRQQSLIGEYYVDCQPGHNPQALKDGATIPDTNTTSTIPPDLVGDILRRPYRDRLRLIIAELGTGLAGRPQDVSELLHKAHPGLRQTDKVLKILGNQRTTIRNFISDSNTVVRELDKKKRDLQDWLVQASRAADVSASRSSAIAAGFQRLPTFLDELNGTMARLEGLTDAQTPLLHNLQDAAPSLTTFLERLGPFSEASRPAIRSLGRASDAGTVAFRHSANEIATLNQLAKDAPAAAKPLRQLLQTLDDRDRSIENNPEAQKSAPPSPDPTSLAKSKGRGFTGLESILNYAYWQTLDLNEFDSVGHVLRAVLLEDPDCSNFLNDLRPGQPNQDRIRNRCNSYLGPSQPGVTTADFTGNGAAKRTAAKKKGERRGRGQPEAGPVKGQTDWSQPHPGVSASQQDLLDSLGGKGGSAQVPQAPGVPGVPSSGAAGADASGSVQQALDYLLGP